MPARSWIIIAAIGFAIASILIWNWSSESHIDISKQATRLLVSGDVEGALAVTQAYLESHPPASDVVMIAGKACVQLKRFEEAVQFFGRVPRTAPKDRLRSLIFAAEIYLDELHLLSLADKCLEEALRIEPENLDAHHLTSVVRGLQSRNRDMVPHLLRLVRSGSFDEKILYLLVMTEDFWFTPEDIRRYHEAAPNDPGPLVTLARFSIMKQQYDVAEDLLEKAERSATGVEWVSPQIGELLHASGNEAAFQTWMAKLSPELLERADINAIIGVWYRDRNELEAAVDFLWKAAKRAPQNRLVHYQLGQVLKSLGHLEIARKFEDRFRLLDKYFLAVHFMREGRGDFLTHIVEAAELAAKLGRDWEAIGWYQIAKRRGASREWNAEMTALLSVNWKKRSLTRSEPGSGLADLLEQPIHEAAALPETAELDDTPQAKMAAADFSFRDVAVDSGFQFKYQSGMRPEARGPERMFEMTGGGIAVADIDNDGWPDIYLSQGSVSGPSAGDELSADSQDAIFRNRRGLYFSRISDLAGLSELSYGQGVTAGDFNNDGFSDIYVCNIGTNRLYLNNGDGTLSDVSGRFPERLARWSTSAIIADLSGDHNPDIYVTDYLEGREVTRRTCLSADQHIITCPPTDFDAAADQLFIGTGDGRFRRSMDDAGLDIESGRGLGVIAADFDGDRSLEIYVANDQTPNFMFVRAANQNEPNTVQFQELGISSSTGLNADGRPEAGMGVAVADIDENGLLDLFVTNFQDESNTLLVQIAPMIFADMTRPKGLAKPSLPMLGFGTQFVDIELDGWPDILTANGHIRFELEGFRMRPQLYHNQGSGFELLDHRRLGAWFRRRQLGRSVAISDWDCDGDEDFLVGHLDTEYALVANETVNSGRWIKLQLIGRRSARDAVGAIATIRSKGRTLTRQLTVGGYQSRSESLLTFGLSSQSEADELTIRWTSGHVDRFTELTTNQHYIAVENVGLYNKKGN